MSEVQDTQRKSFTDEKYDPETAVDYDAVVAVSSLSSPLPLPRTLNIHSQEVAGAFFDDPNLDKDHVELENDR